MGDDGDDVVRRKESVVDRTYCISTSVHPTTKLTTSNSTMGEHNLNTTGLKMVSGIHTCKEQTEFIYLEHLLTHRYSQVV